MSIHPIDNDMKPQKPPPEDETPAPGTEEPQVLISGSDSFAER